MKIFVPLKKLTVRIVPGIIASILLSISIPTYATTATADQAFFKPCFDSIFVEKQFTSRKYKVRLYPNATQQVLFFSASGVHGKIYQLFIFDMDGKLVKQANIKNKQTTVIDNIEKGIYLFQVFSDDERIENGKVTVR